MRAVPIKTEIHPGLSDVLIQGDVLSRMPLLRARYREAVDLIYIDPPFFTGKTFEYRREGETGVTRLPAYADRWKERDYFAFLYEVLEGLYELLKETGSLFVHLDYRAHAQARLMLDDIFGDEGFTNEIIWAYQSGGRAKGHFSRKHDVILYYRKGKGAKFFPEAIGVPRKDTRKNHMKRGVDEEGRAYRSIRSGGKEYRYYDEDRVTPGDVWDDISHLQQKDPERTGFETQKPLKLLERIVLATTEPGDRVMDAFAGSGTTLDAARCNGRSCVGVEIGDLPVAVCRQRLHAGGMVLELQGNGGTVDADVRREGDAVRLGTQGLWYWAVGERMGTVFTRGQRMLYPRAGDSMGVPDCAQPCLHVVDAQGKSGFFDL